MATAIQKSFAHNNRDIIYAGGGDDDVYGYGGNDDIDGQSGDDIIYGGADRIGSGQQRCERSVGRQWR